MAMVSARAVSKQYRGSTKKFNACVNRKSLIKWCTKHKRKGQSVMDCRTGVCGYVKAKKG